MSRVQPVLNSSNSSWMKRFGLQAASCRQTAEQTGPAAECGATAMSEASAIAITLRVGQRPPRCIGSGCQMRTPPRRSSAAKLFGRGEALAGGDRNGRVQRDLDDRVGILVRHRLLEPERVRRRHALREADRLGDAEAAVALDEQVDARADRVAHRLDEVDRERLLVRADDARGVAERVELERRVALARRRTRAAAAIASGVRSTWYQPLA